MAKNKARIAKNVAQITAKVTGFKDQVAKLAEDLGDFAEMMKNFAEYMVQIPAETIENDMEIVLRTVSRNLSNLWIDDKYIDNIIDASKNIPLDLGEYGRLFNKRHLLVSSGHGKNIPRLWEGLYMVEWTDEYVDNNEWRTEGKMEELTNEYGQVSQVEDGKETDIFPAFKLEEDQEYYENVFKRVMVSIKEVATFVYYWIDKANEDE